MESLTKNIEFMEALNVLHRSKPLMKSLSKAAEELNELSTNLLQHINKKSDKDPLGDDILEELVDVQMHILYLQKHFTPCQIEGMVKAKVTKMLNSKDYKTWLGKNKN